jgi:peptide/nickel transport system substrate-binding protein
VIRIRSLWSVLGFLSLVALLFSCSPAATTTTPVKTTAASPTTPPTAATSAAPMAATSTAPSAETPRYGGILSYATSSSVVQLDEAYGPMSLTFSAYTHNELLMGDWAKGPAGTNEADWTYTGNNRYDLKTGAVAESLTVPEPGHLIFTIRKGVRFGLNPKLEASTLVNGRELVADDVVYTLKRLFSEPRAYLRNSYNNVGSAAEITAPDKYTVDFKVPTAAFADAFSIIPDMASIIAPEVVKKYGNLLDWKTCVGTGPFVVTDYVEGSSATFARNDKYWMSDPVGPGKGNHLPYVDGVKLLIIPDLSTRQAALRTAKIDHAGWFDTLEDAKAAKQNAPDIQTKRWLEHSAASIGMKVYREDLPFKDKRVRRALMMATDFDSIKNDLYRGDAEILTWPFAYEREYASIFVPLAEMPASVQELYKYSPDKAKQLLKDAGYPNGFKTRVLVNSASTTQVDLLTAIKAMWAKVNIDLELQPREAGVYNSTWQALNYDEMILSGGMSVAAYFRCIGYDTGSYWNASQVNDATVKAEKAKIYEAFNTMDWKKIDSIHRELLKYVLDQAWNIPTPSAYKYTLWWPWIKNYHGELAVSWAGGANFTQFVWIDTSLREKMTGK